MHKHTLPMRSVTAAAILGLTLSLAPVAVAQEVGDGEGTVTAPAQLIDTAQDGKASLTIHKLVGDESGTNDNGNENADAATGRKPVKGVTFTIQQVKADLTTNAGLEAARKLTVDSAQPTGGSKDIDTDEQGVAAFSNLKIGVYKVTESVNGDETVDGKDTSIVAGKSYLVWVPMTNPDNQNEWNYNVHIYPKNSENKVEKTVEDADIHAGGQVKFNIAGAIPAPGAGRKITNYWLTDSIESEHVEKPSSVKVYLVPVANKGIEDGEELAESEYKVLDTTEENDKWEVKARLTNAGLAKLAGKEKSHRLVMQVVATVKGAGADGKLENTAKTFVQNGKTDSTDEPNDTPPDVPPTPSNKTTTYWGNLKVVKVDSENTETKLKGAEFQIFKCEVADGQAAKKSDLQGEALTVGGKNTWTTGDDGTLTISGLHVTDYADNAELPAESIREYCLVETKAPTAADGTKYELLSAPVRIDFKRADLTEQPDGATAKIQQTANIKNMKSTTPNLPLTGGAGVTLLGIFGALSIVAGVWYARRQAKKA